MTRKKIALVGTYYEQSHGDALLFDCVDFLYRKKGKEKDMMITCKYVDIFGRNKINYKTEKNKKGLKETLKKNSVVYAIYNILFKRLVSIYFEKRERKKLTPYFKEKFNDVDMIVIVGGGLFKYSIRRNFVPLFSLIVEIAEEYNIPVIFNAVGIEGEHQENNYNYKRLRKVINKDIVKMCSTRDQFDILEKYFKGNQKIIRKTADTGVWAKEALNIIEKKSNMIGINIIAPSRFRDYYKKISDEELLDNWKRIIEELTKRKHSIKLFTNGMIDDYEFAKRVISYANLDKSYLLDIPKDEKEMVKNITQFKGIIANRLHTCIVSYSYDIPVIGIAWNDKLLFWGKEIQLSNRFFDYDEVDQSKIVDGLEKAIIEGYDQKYKRQFKQTISDYIGESINYL